MDRPRLLLFSDPGKSRDLYSAELANFDIEVDCANSGEDLYAFCGDKYYSALLIDLRTIIQTGAKNKMLIEEISLKMPTIRLHVNPVSGAVSGLMYDKKIPEKEALKIFVEKAGDFSPTRIRLAKRVNTALNVLISKTPDLTKDEIIKANIINISENGCFITTQSLFEINEFVYIQVVEFECPAPIKAEVRWIQNWGVKNKLPGLGVKFCDLSDNHRSDINKFIKAGAAYKLTV